MENKEKKKKENWLWREITRKKKLETRGGEEEGRREKEKSRI